MVTKRDFTAENKLGLRWLNDGDLTMKDLSEMLGINRRNVAKYIELWRSQNKIRIAGWMRATATNGLKGGAMAPIYGRKDYPTQPDAMKPRALTAAERQREHRARTRAVTQIKKRTKRKTTNRFANLMLK